MAEPTFTEEEGVNIPVQLPEGMADFLKQPVCLDISLPKPVPAKITLPTGGSLTAINDFTKGIPDNCSVGFSLLLQLGPFMGAIKCLIDILNLLKPLIDVINGLPFPPAKALKDFAEAVPPVVECAIAFTPQGGLPLFLRDIICLVIKIVSCLVDQLKSITALMKSLSIQFDAAEGNEQLTASIECAQENAQCAAQGAMVSFEPVLVILELVAPLLEIAQIGPIELPALGDTESVEQIETVTETLEQFVATLELIVEPLGGCD